MLGIDHVQGDPFASPSRVSIHVKGNQAGFDRKIYDTREKKIAFADFLLRGIAGKLRQFSFRAKGSGKSGFMAASTPGQEVLERTACQIDDRTGDITVRMEIGFPANGRTVNSRELEKILFDFLPRCVKSSLYASALDGNQVSETVKLAEDQTFARVFLKENGLAAFVANGSVLPRESGVSSRPMKNAVPFISPKELEVEIPLPNRGTVTGMGIKKGITLIVGGGYHGKSTLLKALELGVYNHISGDGRELVITDDTAVKIRAEDGRSVKKADIRMFINNLPNGKDTKMFCTEDASGSTSQAANVVEAIEAGTSVLLMDEDTSATNFMVRDELMQRVVHRDEEPITPFVERVRSLYETMDISTILVAGSSGSFFHMADCVIQMNHYKPVEITNLAKEAAREFPMSSEICPAETPVFDRILQPDRTFSSSDRIKTKTMGKDGITINKTAIDLRYLEQLTDSEQLNTLALLMKYVRIHLADGKRTISDIAGELSAMLSEQRFEELCGSPVPGNLAVPRKQEICACLNRYRELKII
jgi:predicted ABC-class ATPase